MRLEKYNHPVLFYGGAVGFPWVCWFIAAWLSRQWEGNPSLMAWGSVLGLLGLCGPAGVAMALILPDREMRRELFSQIFNFKGIRPVFRVFSFAIFPVNIVSAQAISLLFGYSASQFKIVEHISFSAGVPSIGIIPAWFLIAAAPVLEEFGWHTYGIHCVRRRFNLLLTCVIFGTIWGVWHAPLGFIKGTYQEAVAETGIIYSINFMASLVPYLIMDNWLYYKTNRNMLLEILFHFEANFFNEIFKTRPDSKIIQTVLLLIFSIIIICKEKKFFFSRSHEEIFR
ncbi:MAG: CPBP family intramembrane metalloprotease [Treponema sp.]|jgi:membrane protease YdiL (CAAX protease family)|nr:CPBP family intramembrane metalloprotease [Treponema sp.]